MAAIKKGMNWIGFDLGGTKMLAAVFNEKFKLLGSCKTKTRGQEGAKAVFERIFSTIDSAITDAGIKKNTIAGIGIGFPGPLDLNKGIVLQAPNLGWKNVPLKKKLEQHFGINTIVANDVDIGTYAEYRFGAAKKAHCVLGVFPGTGIGGACVYQGQIIRSATVSCMELGHIKVQTNGKLCGCGQRGCLETIASRLAITTEAAAAVYRGEAPHLQQLVGTDISKMKSSILLKSVKAGDTVIEAIIKDAGYKLGVGVASVINLLAPDKIILGGGLAEAFPHLLVEQMKLALAANAMPTLIHQVDIATAQLGDYATVKGAAAYVADSAKRST